MSAVLRNTLLSFRDLCATAGPIVLLVVGAVWIAYQWLDPTPPRKVVLATGMEQGAYAEFGRRYADLLSKHGIEVELRHTEGAADNLKLLRNPDSGVDVAFVQGGADDRSHEAALDPEDGDGLVSLGSLFYEPVWIFYRDESAQRLLQGEPLRSLSQLKGWKVSVGTAGSGVPNLMAKLIDANRIEAGQIQLTGDAQVPAVMEFIEGQIDAIVFASAPESVMVQMLLQTPGISLFDFPQADAYSRRFPFLHPVVLPRGVVDLASDLPPQDVRMVAPTATLVAREGTHPALIQLLVQAAQTVHGGAGWFQRKGDFPNARVAERPLAAEAQRYYRAGPPLMQRYLPFWLANLIDRMWVVLVSVVAIAIPLSRVVPPLYQFRIRSRVFRWYGQLRDVENAVGLRPASELSAELDDIERRVEGINVPLSYADELYALRGHINMVRRRLSGNAQPVLAPASPKRSS